MRSCPNKYNKVVVINLAAVNANRISFIAGDTMRRGAPPMNEKGS
jgi:hypothetical protein